MEYELEMRKEIDVGTILDTTIPLTLSIPVTNRSDRILTILKLSKDCSCTAVTIDKTKLAPGETTNLRVITNLAGKSKMFVAGIVVESDAAEKIDEIEIRGLITGQIRIRPARGTLVLGDHQASPEFTVFCDDQTGKWKYLGFTSDDPNVVAELNPKAESPTTSTYAGVVHIKQNVDPRQPAEHRVTILTFNFANDSLRKKLTLLFPVDIVVRRKVMADPSQVTFAHDVKDQKRTVLVQSQDALSIDSAACDSPCAKALLRRIDERTMLVEIAYTSPPLPGTVPPDLTCNLISSGETIQSIPIHILTLP